MTRLEFAQDVAAVASFWFLLALAYLVLGAI